MEKIYLIRKEAVYNHEILGVHTSLNRAKTAFIKLYNDIKNSDKEKWNCDFDGHHNYFIYEIPVNKHFSIIDNGRFRENLDFKVHELKYETISND